MRRIGEYWTDDEIIPKINPNVQLNIKKTKDLEYEWPNSELVGKYERRGEITELMNSQWNEGFHNLYIGA